MPILSEKIKSGIGGVPLPYTKPKKLPTMFARGEVTELPAWIAFDKQVCVSNMDTCLCKIEFLYYDKITIYDVTSAVCYSHIVC
jgi:hypothetical protein